MGGRGEGDGGDKGLGSWKEDEVHGRRGVDERSEDDELEHDDREENISV